ncbi:MAG: hypothetical protein QOI20_132, partial [Acidimicrobiaceae bacterium]|nr:hypothetical protein [Acidimicrobiaceae bacterium]
VLVEVNRPRDAVERALHHGLLDRVPEHAAVRIAAGNWFTPAFVYMHTGRRVEARVGVPADYGGQPCREADAAKGGWADVAVVVDLQTSRVRLSCPTRP